MDNSLIAGMPEVVAYIKKIEEENKKLKEKTVEHLGMAETLHDAVVKENEELTEENKKLKEENKKLARMVADQTLKVCNQSVEIADLMNKVEDFQECVSDHVGDDVEPLDIHNVIQELKDEIDELNDKLEEKEYDETSAQSTENYWKSNYENEVSTNKMLMEAIEANSSEMEKLSDTEYDLDSLKTDLKPLDDMMYEKKICEYEDVVEHVKKLDDYIFHLQEQLVVDISTD